jgi:hypothetical protein
VRKTHLIGLLLWRGGLLFAGGWVVFEAARRLLRLWNLPRPLEIGGGLVLAGFVLVLLSLVLERIQDARNEGDLGT